MTNANIHGYKSDPLKKGGGWDVRTDWNRGSKWLAGVSMLAWVKLVCLCALAGWAVARWLRLCGGFGEMPVGIFK